MADTITLSIILQNSPAAVAFGLQKGSGKDFETVQTQISAADDLHFQCTVTIKRISNGTDIDFAGPFVQGPRNERFIYIDIGTIAGQIDSVWSRRLKIPLKGIDASMIETVLADTHKQLETRIAGTGKDKGPTCGTVKPFAGWKIV